VRWQVEATRAALTAAAGQDTAASLVRPPYGAYTPAVLRWLAELGTTTVLWDVDTSDWQRPGPDAIAEQALSGARNGSIVLFHDGGGDRSQTAAALPRILEGLLGRGFRLVTVAQVAGLPG
jgi:peptidoglycan/xylan/chitin deacetylase (PgdA/CDA1 family)